MRTTAIYTLLLLEAPLYLADNQTSLANVVRGARGMMQDDNHNDQVFLEPKSKPWLGYYDFLINEGSYKFWIVFELFTAALLIYSVFAAIYYAKYTVNDYEDYEDYFFRRKRRSLLDSNHNSLSVDTVLKILQTLADLHDEYTYTNNNKR